MAINASSLIWGPQNQFAFDPTSGKYYQGNNKSANYSPDEWGGSQQISTTDNMWGATNPDGTSNLGVGATQWLFGDKGTAASLNNGTSQGLYDPRNPRYDSGWGGNTQFLKSSDFDLTGLSDDQKKLFGPLADIAVFDHGPNAARVSQAPEESFFSQLTGGNNSELPWYIPKGSPLAAIAGVAGAAVAAASAAGTAAGATGAGTSAIGGVEGAGALGGSASGAGGSALSWTDAIPNWAKGLTESGSTGSSSLADWFKNLTSAAPSGADASWGVNPQNTGVTNMGDDWWSDFLGNGSNFDEWSPASGANYTDSPNFNLASNADEWSPASGANYTNNPLLSQSNIIQQLQQLMKDTGVSPQTALKLLGQLGATGLGIYGANQQSNALSNLSNQYSQMGAPYRAMLAQSYADPNSFLTNSPDIQASVNQGTSALARALSTQGNPTGSGAALQSLQNYATQGLYGQLGNARNSLANFGGLSNFNQAAPGLAGQSIQAQGGALNALGSGISAITNPPTTLEQALNALNGLSGLKMNNGTGL